MQLVARDGKYILHCSYYDRHVAKSVGFWWNPTEKVWWTADKTKAAKLVKYADVSAREELQGIATKLEATKIASAQLLAEIDVPVPAGLAYLPFQKAGIKFMSERKAVLLADEMGVGKTIQTIGLMNLQPIESALVVCPASLKINWQREITKWLTYKLTVSYATPKFLPHSDIVIINYDLLKRFRDRLAARSWDLIVVDEAHFVKNLKAQRTKLVHSLQGKRKLLLTGTPICNRPAELFSLINYLDPVTWPKFWPYSKRYCAAVQTRFGWDFSGASNLPELQDKLRSTTMIRRLKKDVLTELPAKRRQVIEIPSNGATNVIQAENLAFQRHEGRLSELQAARKIAKLTGTDEEYREAVRALKDGISAAFSEMAKLRSETAVAKIPYVLEHLENSLEEDTKIVVFAHHRAVVDAIANHFGKEAVKVYGGTEQIERQKSVDRFQTDDSCRIFVGSITAAGVGITLTASSHVVFAELDWVPGNVTQAEDRLHRIGQAESVLVQHLVLEGSLDARMAKTITEKQEIIEEALDREYVEIEPAGEVPAISAKKKEIEEEAKAISSSESADILAKLHYLAERCDGARSHDGSGFNKIDANIGKTLSQCGALTPKQAALGARILKKYERQLRDAQ